MSCRWTFRNQASFAEPKRGFELSCWCGMCDGRLHHLQNTRNYLRLKIVLVFNSVHLLCYESLSLLKLSTPAARLSHKPYVIMTSHPWATTLTQLFTYWALWLCTCWNNGAKPAGWIYLPSPLANYTEAARRRLNVLLKSLMWKNQGSIGKG